MRRTLIDSDSICLSPLIYTEYTKIASEITYIDFCVCSKTLISPNFHDIQKERDKAVHHWLETTFKVAWPIYLGNQCKILLK